MTAVAPTQQPPLSISKPIPIMPLGDSITEGSEDFAVYRYPLMEKLSSSGYAVEFVGTRTTQGRPESPFGVLRHEGYSGRNIEFIEGIFEEVYRQNPADIILFHAGHNHSIEENPVAGMIRATRSVIAKARSINQQVTVLLAQVIPSGKLPKYAYQPEFNRAIAALVVELNTPAQPVVLVNQAEGFDWQTDTIGDYVHPNAQGAEKMAEKWFQALKCILPCPAPPKPE